MSRRRDAERLLAVWVGREWSNWQWSLTSSQMRWLRAASTRLSNGERLTGADQRQLDRVIRSFQAFVVTLERVA